MSWRLQLQIVLHQVRSPDNLGAVARLMANFGLGRLALSDPLTFGVREAEKMAIKGARVLETMRLCHGLDEALAPCVFALGTSSRSVEGRPSLSPEEGVALLAANAARGEVALVFGGEKRGLSDAELSRCQAIVAIPTALEQPSMNLAQAAAVLLYLCAREGEPGSSATAAAPVAALEASEAKPVVGAAEWSASTETESAQGATLGAVAALEARMREVLLSAGFLNPQAPEHILGELTRSLLRGKLTRREVELWLTAFKQLGRAIG